MVKSGYTAKYTWQCNQVGHLSLGFTGATLVLIAAPRLGGNEWWWGLLFIIVPLLKDVTDVVVDYYRTKKLKQERSKPAGFQPSIQELIADSATDFLFWTTGSMIAVLIFLLESSAPIFSGKNSSESPWSNSSIYLAVCIILIILLSIFIRWKFYTREKNAFDNSKLPFYFRLPNFCGHLENDNDYDVINDFIDYNSKADHLHNQHLLISGSFKSGRTTLATGIGCQLTSSVSLAQFMAKLFNSEPASNDRIVVRYITASKLFEQIEEIEAEIKTKAKQEGSNKQGEWSLQVANVLIIDDVILAELPKDNAQTVTKQMYVNIGTPVPVRTSHPNAFNLLNKKSIIWVVSDLNQIEQWKNWVHENFSKPEDVNITSRDVKDIKLKDVDNKAVRQPTQPEFGLSTLPGILSAVTLLVSLFIVIGSILIILQADRLGKPIFWSLLSVLIASTVYWTMQESKKDSEKLND